MARNMDMTRGPIMKLIVLFALPICAGNILQQLYNTVDTLVIGNFCGTQSLAAVGTSGQPVELLPVSYTPLNRKWGHSAGSSSRICLCIEKGRSDRGSADQEHPDDTAVDPGR